MLSHLSESLSLVQVDITSQLLVHCSGGWTGRRKARRVLKRYPRIQGTWHLLGKPQSISDVQDMPLGTCKIRAKHQQL